MPKPSEAQQYEAYPQPDSESNAEGSFPFNHLDTISPHHSAIAGAIALCFALTLASVNGPLAIIATFAQVALAFALYPLLAMGSRQKAKTATNLMLMFMAVAFLLSAIVWVVEANIGGSFAGKVSSAALLIGLAVYFYVAASALKLSCFVPKWVGTTMVVLAGALLALGVGNALLAVTPDTSEPTTAAIFLFLLQPFAVLIFLPAFPAAGICGFAFWLWLILFGVRAESALPTHLRMQKPPHYAQGGFPPPGGGAQWNAPDYYAAQQNQPVRQQPPLPYSPVSQKPVPQSPRPVPQSPQQGPVRPAIAAEQHPQLVLPRTAWPTRPRKESKAIDRLNPLFAKLDRLPMKSSARFAGYALLAIVFLQFFGIGWVPIVSAMAFSVFAIGFYPLMAQGGRQKAMLSMLFMAAFIVFSVIATVISVFVLSSKELRYWFSDPTFRDELELVGNSLSIAYCALAGYFVIAAISIQKVKWVQSWVRMVFALKAFMWVPFAFGISILFSLVLPNSVRASRNTEGVIALSTTGVLFQAPIIIMVEIALGIWLLRLASGKVLVPATIAAAEWGSPAVDAAEADKQATHSEAPTASATPPTQPATVGATPNPPDAASKWARPTEPEQTTQPEPGQATQPEPGSGSAHKPEPTTPAQPPVSPWARPQSDSTQSAQPHQHRAFGQPPQR